MGRLQYVWIGEGGIQRITYNGGTPMDVLHITQKGFDLTFTRPVDEALASDPENYQCQWYYYEYHEAYGSDRMDIATVNVKAVDISDDGKKVSLTFSKMVPGYVYDLTIQNLKSKKGVKLINKRLFYTANNIL